MFYEGPLISLHVISDMVIFLAYYSIPFALVYFVRRRRDVAFGLVFWMFAAFILACGTTHLFGVLDIWQPYYRLDGIVKAITAALSIITAIALWKLMPQLLAIPSAAALEATVQLRTADLEKANVDLRLATASKLQSTAHLQAVVDSIVEGLITSDANGEVFGWNPAALEMHGFRSIAEARQNLSDLSNTFELRTLDNRLIPLESWPMSRTLRGETFSGLEVLLRRLDTGAERIVSYSGTPVRNSSSAVVLAVLSLHDITDRKRAEKERERLLQAERAARTEAERANHVKDEFLATLSHELRTPLNAILGWSQLLRRPDRKAPDLTEGLAVIERNSRAQTQLISDLLDMSRIMSGKFKLEMQLINLAEVTDAALASVLPTAAAKNITLERLLDKRLPPLLGDATRLQQVVWNILANAIKFTPTGGKVSVALRRIDDCAQIVVSDTGHGISPHFLPHVFERFRQSDGSTTRRHGGLGIGLSIVKNIVESHGGTGCCRRRRRSRAQLSPSRFRLRRPRTIRRRIKRELSRALHPRIKTRNPFATKAFLPASKCSSWTTSPTPSTSPRDFCVTAARTSSRQLPPPMHSSSSSANGPTCSSATLACPGKTATSSSKKSARCPHPKAAKLPRSQSLRTPNSKTSGEQSPRDLMLTSPSPSSLPTSSMSSPHWPARCG